MTRPAVIFTFALAACSSGGKSGSPGSAGASPGGAAGTGSGGAAGTGSGGATGTGSGGATGTGSGGAAGSAGCGADAAASSCFVRGSWQIDNLSPCFFTVAGGDGGTSEGAISTVQSGLQVECPTDLTEAPTASWSTDALTTDCVGHYRLCYTLKAGSAASPQPNDCVVAQSCAEGDYLTANQLQPWPALPGWVATGSQRDCAQTFTESGGYGEKSVTETVPGCGPIMKVLGTVSYCPLSCNGPNPPAACADCSPGASDGGF
jgi:hypothetical protein